MNTAKIALSVLAIGAIGAVAVPYALEVQNQYAAAAMSSTAIERANEALARKAENDAADLIAAQTAADVARRNESMTFDAMLGLAEKAERVKMANAKIKAAQEEAAKAAKAAAPAAAASGYSDRWAGNPCAEAKVQTIAGAKACGDWRRAGNDTTVARDYDTDVNADTVAIIAAIVAAQIIIDAQK